MLARPLAPADRQVEVRLGEIAGIVGGKQYEAQLRIRLRHFGKARHQPFLGQVARRGNGQRLGRLPRLHRAHRFLELQEAVTQRRQPRLRLGRQLQPARRAAEQHDSQRILQRTDLLADGGGRHRQLVRRAREAQVPRRRIQHAQAVEGKMRALHVSTAGASSANRGIDASNACPASSISR
ncbi:hypothetical protein WR25_17440 [Diploscapter pachys]|uniref:Uncharacterized protein n=1 Tax=Diploscapter pachys TaxID=2018661 RepID=A0A2A2K378_9BILA|nr:hypothetical protein WR25_17440 [Diploscapter pachys]